jgi:hypothetical protein
MFEQAFRNIDDVLRKEAGCTTELDYTEQTSWLLFLKYLDGLEQDRADEAALSGKKYTFMLDKPCRWESWAAPKGQGANAGKLDHNRAQTGDDLHDFVDKKLFPYLRGFKQKAEGPGTIEYQIGEIFGEIQNNIRSGYNLREIIDHIDELRFRSQNEKHELSHLYEAKIKNMGNAGRNGGEYYTPRPPIRAMVQVVRPEIGQRIYDGACGSAGFLCEAFDYLDPRADSGRAHHRREGRGSGAGPHQLRDRPSHRRAGAEGQGPRGVWGRGNQRLGRPPDRGARERLFAQESGLYAVVRCSTCEFPIRRTCSFLCRDCGNSKRPFARSIHFAKKPIVSPPSASKSSPPSTS